MEGKKPSGEDISHQEGYSNNIDAKIRSPFVMAGGIACLVFGVVVLATLFLSRAGSIGYALILVDANITFFIGASLVSIGTYLALGLGGRSDDAALGTPYQV